LKHRHELIVSQIFIFPTPFVSEKPGENVLRYQLSIDEKDCDGDCKELVREKMATLLGEGVHVNVKDYHEEL